MLGGRRGEADSDHQEQVVCLVDEGMVLLQGSFACLLAGREIHACPLFEHELPELSYGTPFRLR
jgi:hypothetical protein